MSKAARNRLFLLAAALLFSTGGAAIKGCSLSSWQVAGGRSGIAAIALYAFLPEARSGWTRRTVFTGCAYAATLILFVLATKETTSANAIFLQSTAPLYLLLLGPLVLREPVRGVDFAVIATVGAGAALLLLGSQNVEATAPEPLRGNLMGLAAGVTWALTITGLRSMGRKGGSQDGSAATVIVGNLIAFVICLPMSLPIGPVRAADWAVLIYLGLFQVSLAYVFLTRSLREVPGLEAATLLLLEPVFNPVWTWLIQGERPASTAIAGGMLIVAGAFGGTVWRFKFTQISQLPDTTPPD